MRARWHLCAVAVLWGALQSLGMPAPELSSKASAEAYELGKAFDVAMQAEFPAPWHAYYRNPGTVGEAMRAELTAPEGFHVEGPYWSAPVRHEGAVGVAYVYEKPVVVWRVTPGENAPAQATFSMKASAQLCSDAGCLPVQHAAATLEMRRGAATPNPAWHAEQQLVETLGDTPLQQVSASRTPEGAALRFELSPAREVESAYFFSDDNAVSPTAAQPLSRSGNAYVLTLTANDGQDVMYPAPGGGLRRLAGTLVLSDGTHARVEMPVASSATASGGVPEGLWAAVAGLFLGGLLLNLMPCVFPVLGLKIMGFVSLSGGSRSRVVWHSLSFVAGVLISFWALGLLLIAASNAELLAHVPWQEWAGILLGDEGAADRSWATWMQHEWVAYGIMLLLLVLGLSMYGVFEIGARATGIGGELQQRGGYAGSFFQGLLVTLVATPCSAPFLGAAMPAAMSFPALWMLLALTAMALGLSLPYLLLGMYPDLVRLLPRPGAWMESLKQGLSFFLFAAAAWMLDVYLSFASHGSRGADTAWILMSLVVFCAAFWVYGRWCALYRSRLSRCVGLLAALALAALGIWGSMPSAPRQDAPEWEPWTPQAMQKALDAGTPVYVDFTAKWCATCQSNKKLAYSDAVYELLDEHDVKLMRADKTQPNPEIDAELRRLHRNAVPTNALYLPGREPVVTRELLTDAYLLDFLSQQLSQAEEEEE